MEDDNDGKYPQVNAIKHPLYLLIKLPGTNKVQFVYGINIFLGSPLETKPALEGQLLACHEDIYDTTKQPPVIVLPKDSLKIQDVDISTIEDFDGKLKLNKDSTKTWLTTKTSTTSIGLAKMLPLP